MTTTELLAIFRAETSTVVPYFWSDPLVYGYIDDAQKQFCRKTYGIEDSKSFKLKITPATEWYAVNKSILQIQSAHDTATGAVIPVKTLEQLDGVKFNGATGPLDVLIQGMQKRSLRAYPVPKVAQTLWLRTLRLPVDVEADSDFEIDDHNVLGLLHWVKYRAYSNPDIDGGDSKRANEYLLKFEAYCNEAKTEQGRLRRQPVVTTFGGIR